MTLAPCSEVESFVVQRNARKVVNDSFSGCRQLKSLVFENPYFDFKFVNVIIAYLTKMCRGNVGHKGLVNAKASSARVVSPGELMNSPEKAIDLDRRRVYYRSENKLNQWVCLNFKAQKVSVTHYSLCGNNNKSRILEGLCDDSEWDQLDKRGNNENMNECSFQTSFTVVNQGEYRLRQTEKGHDGCDYLVLRKIELFGTPDSVPWSSPGVTGCVSPPVVVCG